MKNVLLSISAAILLSGLASAEAWANPQHERMKRCSQEAKEKTLKGDERKQFMSGCLKGKHAPASATAVGSEQAKGSAAKSPPAAVADSSASAPEHKARTKECNQAATEKTLKGAERKSFISACMKG